jgi:CPA1 family monovalent cation:H+ antiporter
MPLSSVALIVMAMLLTALLLEPAARRLHLPFSAALVAGGFAGVQLITSAGFDTGLRWYHFHDLVFFVFLPALIFESAIHLNARLLLRNLLPVLLLALPFLLVSTLITAALLYYGIGHPSGFPWITALICGALLAATDPVAVTDIAKRLHVPERLLTMMEGESLTNDATTVVLFTLLVSLAVTSRNTIDVASAGLDFLVLAFGGLGVGLGTGILAGWLIRHLRQPVVTSLLAAYGAYLIAETQLHVSGIMACLACGLWLGHRLRIIKAEYHPTVSDWWQNLGWLANSALFLLAGATITLNMFEERWLAMLIGIGAALVTRLFSVWSACSLASAIPGQQTISRDFKLLMTVGGLRGAVTLALVLSLPTELEGWWTVQSTAYGVVLFSLFVQAPLIEPMLKHLNKRLT